MKGDKELLNKVDRARWWALQNAPFYGQLMMGLIDMLTDQRTASTDGKRIKWGRDFLARLDDRKTRFVLLHETLHCAHLHGWRLPYDEDGNKAGDYAINLTLRDSGLDMQMPENGLCSDEWKGKAEEEILAALRRGGQQGGQPGGAGNGGGSDSPAGEPDGAEGEKDKDGQPGAEDGPAGEQGEPSGEDSEPDKDGEADGDGPGAEDFDPGECGGFEKPAEEEQQPPEKEQEAAGGSGVKGPGSLREEWETRIVQAAMACQSAGQGNMPAGARILLDRVKAQRVDWRAETSEFCKTAIGNRNDWQRSARRMATAPVIYPRRNRDRLGLVIFARDTSGSVDAQTVAAFNALISDCLAEVGTAGIVMDCDAALQSETRLEPGEEPPGEAKGGGGTSFCPVFTRAAELIENGEQIAGLVYLTDGAGCFPAEPPAFPVLWVLTESRNVPFGNSVQIHS